MPYLGIAEQRVADQIGSGATKGERRQNMLCAYLGGAPLIGLFPTPPSAAGGSTR